MENCHLKSHILPNFVTKIAKFCHKNRKICQIFAKKITKFFKLSKIIEELLLFPEIRNITLTQKCTQKVNKVHIRKKIKTRVPKLAKTEREASKFNYPVHKIFIRNETVIHCNTRTPKPLSIFTESPSPV